MVMKLMRILMVVVVWNCKKNIYSLFLNLTSHFQKELDP